MNERTRLFVAMGLAAVILFGWVPMLQLIERSTGWALLPVMPPPSTQPVATQPTTQTASPSPSIALEPPTTGPAGSAAPVAALATRPAGTISVPVPAPVPATRPAAVRIGSAVKKDKQFAVQLAVDPVGGGLSEVILNSFDDRVGSDAPFTFEKPYDEQTLALGTQSIKIDGVDVSLAGGVWRVENSTERSATLALDLPDANGAPVLTLLKTYEVFPRDEGGSNGPLGYDTKFTYAYVNRTGRPLIVSSTLNGPSFPPTELAYGYDRQVVAGYQGRNAVVMQWDALESLTGSAATKDYTTYENQPLVWFGAGGNYFNGIVRPVVAKGEPSWIKSAQSKTLNPDAPVNVRKVRLNIETADVTLAPGATKAVEARVFFGPRKREIVKNPYYSAIGYQHTLETGGSCAFCTFQWLVDFLMLLLGVFQVVLRDWGLAIIALVFVVRAVLHPISKRAQINMAKMGKMGPEIERIKKKYGDDKEGLNKAMMGFYKTQGAAPVLGCLPMFLQMPIWIALYSGLSSTFELRQAPFLEFFGRNLTWIHDLSKPDHLIKFDQSYNLFILQIDGLNVIPFLLAAGFFLQQKFTPKPVASTPEQEQQQKMMQWMTLLFPVFLYSSPSGLNLYILTSTIFGIVESKIIRKHIAEKEALAAVGPTFVDGEVVDSTPARTAGRTKAAEPKKTGGLMGWFTQLQEKAEQLRNDAEKKAKERRK